MQTSSGNEQRACIWPSINRTEIWFLFICLTTQQVIIGSAVSNIKSFLMFGSQLNYAYFHTCSGAHCSLSVTLQKLYFILSYYKTGHWVIYRPMKGLLSGGGGVVQGCPWLKTAQSEALNMCRPYYRPCHSITEWQNLITRAFLGILIGFKPPWLFQTSWIINLPQWIQNDSVNICRWCTSRADSAVFNE